MDGEEAEGLRDWDTHSHTDNTASCPAFAMCAQHTLGLSKFQDWCKSIKAQKVSHEMGWG